MHKIQKLGDIFEFNPTVKLSKGTTAPYVAMESIESWVRNVYTTKEKSYSGGVKFLDGDVLLARITPSLENGKTSIYRAASGVKSSPAFGSTEFIVIRGKDGISTSDYAYYVMRTPQIRDAAIASMTGSSGRQRVQNAVLEAIEWPLPSLDEQRDMVSVLGALDDKIESNHKMVQLLKALLHTKVQEFEESSTTEKLSVSSLARFVNGGAYTKGASGSGRVVIRIAELNSGIGVSTVYNDIDVPEDKTAHFGDVLMSWSGSLGVYIWDKDEAIVNQHIFKVIEDGFPLWFVYDRLQTVIAQFRAIAADKATTMGHIKRSHLDEIKVPVFNEMEFRQLEVIVEPLWKRVLLVLREIQTLTSLRNALLPELMSGRLRVDEAGRVVASVVDIESGGMGDE